VTHVGIGHYAPLPLCSIKPHSIKEQTDACAAAAQVPTHSTQTVKRDQLLPMPAAELLNLFPKVWIKPTTLQQPAGLLNKLHTAAAAPRWHRACWVDPTLCVPQEPEVTGGLQLAWRHLDLYTLLERTCEHVIHQTGLQHTAVEHPFIVGAWLCYQPCAVIHVAQW